MPPALLFKRAWSSALATALATSLAGCACAKASDQAGWPKSAGTDPVEDWRDDGGHSLEPRAAAVAVEQSKDKQPEPAASNTEPTAPTTEVAPALSTKPDDPPATTKPDEPPPEIMLQEEIIINIE